MSETSPVITEDDLTALNQRALLRTIELTRRAAVALLVVAAILALAWLWQAARMQGLLQDDAADAPGFFFTGEDLTLKQRIDTFSTFTAPLAYAALAFGMGIGLRLYCDAATVRAGARLTGWEVGEPIESDDDEG